MQQHLWSPPPSRHGPRPTVLIVLSSVEQMALERFCRCGRTEYRVAMRARAILLAATGWQNDAIARDLHRHHSSVRTWRKRFAHDRLAGLIHLRIRDTQDLPMRLWVQAACCGTSSLGRAATPSGKARTSGPAAESRSAAAP